MSIAFDGRLVHEQRQGFTGIRWSTVTNGCDLRAGAASELAQAVSTGHCRRAGR
ncbi:MAG: hypothetical protein U0869_07060 [Chloroflexota bacterium]